MASLRTSYWYISLYLKKHNKIIIGAVVAGIALFAILLPLLTYLPQVKPTRYVGIVGFYEFSQLPAFIQNQVSLGLTTVEEDGSVSPQLAERWSIEDDGKMYRFILKKGIRWQDGKQFLSDDISVNFQDTQVITTENEIIIKLTEQPFSPFPSVMSQPLFRETQEPFFYFFRRKKIIGLGPYSITKVVNQEGKVVELTIESVKERIVYRFYLTEDRAKVAYQHGKIDEIRDISDATNFESWPNTKIEKKMNTDQYLGLFFNLEDPLFEKNVRQALSYALTKGPAELRAKGPINPLSYAYLDGVKSYAFDPPRAIERFMDQLPAQPLNINLVTTPRFQANADQVKKEWEIIGQQAYQTCMSSSDVKDKAPCENLRIAVNITVTNFPDVGNYQVMLVGQQIPKDPDQYTLWHSTQNTNFTHYKNPRIDALLENGRKISDQTERKAIYQEFQQFLLEDAPAVFMQYLESFTVERT